jgi:hypothetical protein
MDDERAVHAAQHEMAAASFVFAFDRAEDTDWRSYVADRRRMQNGIDLPPGLVPATFLVATIDDVIVGRTSIPSRAERLATRLRRPHRLRRAAAVPASRVRHPDTEAVGGHRAGIRG